MFLEMDIRDIVDIMASSAAAYTMIRGIRSVFGVRISASSVQASLWLTDSQPFSQPSVRRSFATVTSADPSSAASGSSSQSQSVGNERPSPNLIFQDGDVDITDSMLKMLEQDQSGCPVSHTKPRRLDYA